MLRYGRLGPWVREGPNLRASRDQRELGERSMTLCIAAVCREYFDEVNWEQRAVLLYDKRVTSGITGGDTGEKLVGLTGRWLCLLSGDLADARGLANAFKTALEDVSSDIAEDWLIARLKAAARDYVANEYTASALGRTYKQFLRMRQQLGDATFDRHLTAIETAKLPQFELLLIGWLGAKFELVKYDYGDVYACANSAVIGTGAQIAETIMFYRDHVHYRSVGEAMYVAFEAHRFGVHAPNVSLFYDIAFVRLDPVSERFKVRFMRDPRYLFHLWNEYGLRELPPHGPDAIPIKDIDLFDEERFLSWPPWPSS
jgi:hypothetical protein